MKITWDESKRKQNLEKHGIDFVDAESIFSKPMLIKKDFDEITRKNGGPLWASLRRWWSLLLTPSEARLSV
jgi:hypothetical protein